MDDISFVIQDFGRDADDVARWCELVLSERIETTVRGDTVVIHPRPRQLTEAEWKQLEEVLLAAKPCSLSVDKARISADGEDYATVTVRSTGESIDLLVRDQVVTVPLKDGIGTLEITATAPTIEPIVIRAKEPLVYGFAQVEVEAI